MRFLAALSLLLLFTHSLARAQQSCCALAESPRLSATARFAALAEAPGFAAAHLEPLPFRLAQPQGEMVRFAADGKEAQAYLLRASAPSARWVFVFHEWWGLNDYVRAQAERLHADLNGAANVLAVDMYDGAVAATREQAGKLMQGLAPERSRAILKGAVAYAGPQAQIATIGWCMGGGLSMQASLAAGAQARACIIYYGMPEMDSTRLAGLAAPVLLVVPTQDKWITPAMSREFAQKMNEAKKSLTVSYFDADHAFANPSNPRHNSQAARQAWAYSLAFLRTHLME